MYILFNGPMTMNIFNLKLKKDLKKYCNMLIVKG